MASIRGKLIKLAQKSKFWKFAKFTKLRREISGKIDMQAGGKSSAKIGEKSPKFGVEALLDFGEI